METKNNFNYDIESGNLIFGGKTTKFALLFFSIIEINFILLILIPLFVLSNLFTTFLIFGAFSFINLVLAINWTRNSINFYQLILNSVRYKHNPKQFLGINIIQNKLVYKKGNTYAWIENNKIVFKSFFQISIHKNIDAYLKETLNDFLILFQEENVRLYSIKSKFEVSANLDRFHNLIDEQIDFSKNDILKNNSNKLLIQQLANFQMLNDSIDENNIHIIEFTRQYQIPSSDKKINFKDPAYAYMISNFRTSENTFRTNLQNIKLSNLNPAYLKAIRQQILLLDSEIEYKVHIKNIEAKNNQTNEIKWYRYLKVTHMTPLLDTFYLYSLFNNPWNYEVNVTYTALTEKDEDKIIRSIENAASDKKMFRFKKIHRRAQVIKQELNIQSLDEAIAEIQTQQYNSKVVSILIKIDANSSKELNKKVKFFKSYFKKQRFYFNELTYLQQPAFIDFHIGVENKLRRNGKEKKYRLFKRRFNNINAHSLWLTAIGSAYSLPIKEAVDIEASGWIYGSDSLNNPVAIDFDIKRPSPHIAIFGQSGSGKTTASEYLLNQKLIKTDHRDPIVIIIDPKNEYQDIVKQYGGQTFNLSEGFANPFKRNDKQIEQRDKEFVTEFLRNLLFSLNLNLEITIVRLKELIFSSKAWVDNEFTFDQLIILVSQSKMLVERMGIDSYNNLLDFIRQYGSSGIESQLFNQNISFDYSKRIISINFSELINNGSVSSQTSTLIFCVLRFINNLMAENNPKFQEVQKYKISIFVDEFHLLVNPDNNTIIKQFDSLYAISRSFGVSIITITQNLQILNRPGTESYARSIFSNVSYFIMFSQQKEQFKAMKEMMPEQIIITEAEEEEMTSGKIHQSLILYNDQKKFVFWKLGLFYDSNRDENKDGLKDLRIQEYQNLNNCCEEYIQLEKKYLKNI